MTDANLPTPEQRAEALATIEAVMSGCLPSGDTAAYDAVMAEFDAALNVLYGDDLDEWPPT